MIDLLLFHVAAFLVGLVVMLLFTAVFAFSKSHEVAFAFMLLTSWLIGVAIVSNFV